MKKTLFSLSFIASALFANAQSTTFQWAKSWGAVNNETGYSIKLDGYGNVYTIGSFSGTVDFNPDAGVYNLTSSGSLDDIFVSKLDNSGHFLWAIKMGGTGNDYGASLAVDLLGNVIITGYFYNTVDFDPGSGVYNLTSAGSNDIFVCKLDFSGNFLWAENIGGTSVDAGYSVAVDSLTNIYTTGYFYNTVDFNAGAGIFNLTSAGAQDIFVLTLDSFGNFTWAKPLGGAGSVAGIPFCRTE